MSNENTAAGNGQAASDKQSSNIDAALAAAKRRKAAKAGEGGGAPEAAKAPRKVYTDEERIANTQKLNADRAKRKADRKKATDDKRAEAAKNRGTPHMSKVEKAAKGLAPMDGDTETFFNEIKGALGAAQIDILTAHLAFYSRASATKGSLEIKLAPGARVKIVSGSPKLIGKTGTVAKWQRVRCFILVDGIAKEQYLFNANVEALEEPAAAEAPSEPPTDAAEPAAEEQAATPPAEVAAA